MSPWRQLVRGLRALTNRSAVDEELDDEVRDFFERAYADVVRQNPSPEEAEHAARRTLRAAVDAREALRAYGWENAVEATLADLRHALRGLVQSPVFSVVAVLTLALGIGASTAIFSAVVPILFEPLPYPSSHRIVTIADRSDDGSPLDVAYGTYVELAARSRVFERLAVADRWQPALVGAGESERLAGDLVTADYFRVLGVAPALGRNFDEGDDAPGAPPAAIVSDGLAKRRFGSASAVLNRTIRLDGTDHTVIGVMPADFDNVFSPAAEVWAPRRYRDNASFDSPEWGHHMRMLGRLAPGVSLEHARAELAALAAARVDEFPRPRWAALENGFLVASLQGAVTAGARPVLLALVAAVLLLLVIACANVANLLLARSVGRRAELAMRAALGAGRARLVRQLLTESVLLAFLGGVAGLGVALAGVRVILALAPADLPRIDAIRLDVPAFAFALAITTLVGLVVGLAPALHGTRPSLDRDLRSGARTTGASHHGLRRALVVTEIALALVLLTSAGLLVRSVDKLLATAPGFDAANLLTMEVVAPRDTPPDAALRYFQSVLDAVRAVAGVVDAAFTSQLPLRWTNDVYGVQFESSAPNDRDGALRYAVTPEWFRTMRIPLVEGRLLDARDRPDASRAVLLSESFARRKFGEESPVGARLRIGPDMNRPDSPWAVVVGVVGDVKQTSLALAPPDAFYVAAGQWNWVDTTQSLAVRTVGDPLALVPAVKRAIWSVDAAPPLARIATMEELVAASETQRRFARTVFMLFAGAALVLAALGLYGVIAGSVAERVREIGLRSALGATPRQILSLIVRQGMALAGIGGAIGLAAAAAASRGLESMLFGVSAWDPATYGSVTVLLAAVAAAACSVPAWKAARIEPTVALRSE